ncbi:MAG: hypothetical protein HY332_23965 [Chloroflexi bacterium]|nr:hypothetical protein [Chloroflexota bacterium]
MEGCGDVICFAASFRPEGLRDATPGAFGERHVYSFEHQLGTHASIGGDQSYPFLILPTEIPFDPMPIEAADQLHPFLRSLVPDRRDDAVGEIRHRVPRGPVGARLIAPERPSGAINRALTPGDPATGQVVGLEHEEAAPQRSPC